MTAILSSYLCGPLGPLGPVGPEGPVGPVVPLGPLGPLDPVGPTVSIELANVIAISQTSLYEPVGPLGPLAPLGPLGPLGPVGPLGPLGPAGPIALQSEYVIAIADSPYGSVSAVQVEVAPLAPAVVQTQSSVPVEVGAVFHTRSPTLNGPMSVMAEGAASDQYSRMPSPLR